MQNVLILGAHYDDLELGVGGTAYKLSQNGKKVYKITLTDTEVISKEQNVNIKAENAWCDSGRACEILGVEQLKIHQAKHGQLEYNLEMMQEIEHIIFEKNIDTVFIHYFEDYNTDHVVAHQLCKTAARHVKNLLMFHTNPYVLIDNFSPNMFVDISDCIEYKQKALECYEKDHNRRGNLFETCKNRNSVWGYAIQKPFAEAFQVIKYRLEE